jgi:hypothetical protein
MAEPRTTTDAAAKAPGQRPFAAFLQEHRHGSLHAELSEQLGTLVSAVVEHGKPGTLTLAIKVSPNKDGMTVTVTDEVTAKEPKPERGGALYFTDQRGNLSRRNPNQIELPLREVSGEGGAP